MTLRDLLCVTTLGQKYAIFDQEGKELLVPETSDLERFEPIQREDDAVSRNYDSEIFKIHTIIKDNKPVLVILMKWWEVK